VVGAVVGAVVQWCSGVRSKKRRKNALRLKFWLNPLRLFVFLLFCHFVILPVVLGCAFFQFAPARPPAVR
jgi:hypothetical protein